MKRTAIILVTVLTAATLGYYLAAPRQTASPTVNHAVGFLPEAPPTTTDTNPVEVFQRAFWKRPTASDRILHAERREWSDSKGVQQWQWFIAVQPSPELVRHLRDDNAFHLVPSKSPKAVDRAPVWFAISTDEATSMQSPTGNMLLSFNDKTHTLYATDAGGGFHPGAAEPAKPFPQPPAIAGRLPTTSPPKP